MSQVVNTYGGRKKKRPGLPKFLFQDGPGTEDVFEALKLKNIKENKAAKTTRKHKKKPTAHKVSYHIPCSSLESESAFDRLLQEGPVSIPESSNNSTNSSNDGVPRLGFNSHDTLGNEIKTVEKTFEGPTGKRIVNKRSHEEEASLSVKSPNFTNSLSDSCGTGKEPKSQCLTPPCNELSTKAHYTPISPILPYGSTSTPCEGLKFKLAPGRQDLSYATNQLDGSDFIEVNKRQISADLFSSFELLEGDPDSQLNTAKLNSIGQCASEISSVSVDSMFTELNTCDNLVDKSCSLLVGQRSTESRHEDHSADECEMTQESCLILDQDAHSNNGSRDNKKISLFGAEVDLASHLDKTELSPANSSHHSSSQDGSIISLPISAASVKDCHVVLQRCSSEILSAVGGTVVPQSQHSSYMTSDHLAESSVSLDSSRRHFEIQHLMKDCSVSLEKCEPEELAVGVKKSGVCLSSASGSLPDEGCNSEDLSAVVADDCSLSKYCCMDSSGTSERSGSFLISENVNDVRKDCEVVMERCDLVKNCLVPLERCNLVKDCEIMLERCNLVKDCEIMLERCNLVKDCQVMLERCEPAGSAGMDIDKGQNASIQKSASIASSSFLEPLREKEKSRNSLDFADISSFSSTFHKSILPETVVLKPGKQWRRSLSILSKIRTSAGEPSEFARRSMPQADMKRKGKRWESTVNSIIQMQPSNDVIPEDIEEVTSRLSLTGRSSRGSYVPTFEENLLSSLVVCDTSNRTSNDSTASQIYKRCGQDGPLPFLALYPLSMKKNCKKIGEGVYGEVFSYSGSSSSSSSVIKIIPIEGEMEVNGEPQKTFGEIFSEVCVAQELSNLSQGTNNVTYTFNQVQAIRCVQGCYPDWLQELWHDYNDSKGSENDSPEMFEENQLFIVLELQNGGKDLESFIFSSADQGLAAFRQIALTLAVGENALSFEHRDLHWGNVLISSTRKKEINFILNGKALSTPSRGIEVSIIDFTLSRITDPLSRKAIFYDLARDETLFTAEGDYQFDIYRMMKDYCGNEWESFRPKTNVAWLHYILDKLCTMARYKNRTSKVHNRALDILSEMRDTVLFFDDVTSFVNCSLFSK